jgi:hypothetical protein
MRRRLRVLGGELVGSWWLTGCGRGCGSAPIGRVGSSWACQTDWAAAISTPPCAAVSTHEKAHVPPSDAAITLEKVHS